MRARFVSVWDCRSWCGPRSHSVAPVAVSARPKSGTRKRFSPASPHRRSVRSLSSGRSRDGARLSTRSSVTLRERASRSATWKTSIRWACTPATRWLSHPRRHSRIASISSCAVRHCASSTLSVSRAAATCSSRWHRTRTSTTSLRSTRACRVRLRSHRRRPAFRSRASRPRSPRASDSTRSRMPSPGRRARLSSRRSTTASSRSRAGRSTSSPRPTVASGRR